MNLSMEQLSTTAESDGQQQQQQQQRERVAAAQLPAMLNVAARTFDHACFNASAEQSTLIYINTQMKAGM